MRKQTISSVSESNSPEAKGMIKDEADGLFSGLRRSPARPAIRDQRELDWMLGAFRGDLDFG